MKKTTGTLGVVWFVALAWMALLPAARAQQPPAGSEKQTAVSALHAAARAGDLAALRSQLRAGASPNLRDEHGRTPLMDAVAAGQLPAIGVLLQAGADVEARAHDNCTPLLEAASEGQLEAARALIDAGAQLNAPERGWGTPLETAERTGHSAVAALLRGAGARSTGHSPGDTVCVRPWGGEGYCGLVLAVDKTQYQLRVTRIVGCENGCPARPSCSAGRAVGGPDGIAVGDTVDTVSWCLTHTGVNP